MILLPAVAFAMPGADASWTVLQSSNPRIECTTVGTEPWCRSSGSVAVPIDKVANTLEHMAEYQHLFSAITRIDVLAPDTMHIVLDYPFPLTDRDYVAKYTRSVEGEIRRYRWDPVVHPGAPETNDAVRLPRMAGEWRLEPAGAETKVTYLWQAEIAGSLPAGAYETARKTAGNEAIKDLGKAAAAAD
ncbi:MAG: hypothetical protein ABMA64_03575 [Myxococcota bacterium]